MLNIAPSSSGRAALGLPKPQRGVMLLEALISIAVFSIGVLGLIGLQSAAIKNTDEARQRAVAAFYANQIIGQMWADARADLASYKHQPDGDSPTSNKCVFSGVASTNVKVSDWVAAIEKDLNGTAGTGLQQIKVDAATNVVTVTLCWKNPQESVSHFFTTAAQIQG